MNETNKHAWLKGVSVEIKKGNVDLKIGPKATAPTPTTTTQVVPSAAPSHPPRPSWGFQDWALVLAVVALVIIVGRALWKKLGCEIHL